MRADKIIFCIIGILISAVVVLLCRNKGSEKILYGAIPVILTTTLAAGLGSLLVVMRPETKTEEFVSILIYDTNEKKPLLSPDYPLVRKAMIIGNLWEDGQESKQQKPEPDFDLLANFLARCIIERLCSAYSQHWLIDSKSWKLPFSEFQTWGPAREANTLPKIKLTREHISKILRDKENPFYLSKDSMWDGICLPKGTTLSYERSGSQQGITLNNTFVTIQIVLRPSHLEVITKSFYGFPPLKTGEDRRYYQAAFLIGIKITYKSWRAGEDMMTYQKRWAESLLLTVRQTFDWAISANELKESWMTEQLSKLQ